MQLISNLLLCFKDVIPIVDVSLEFIPTRLSLPLGHLALYENQFVSPEGLTHDVSYQYMIFFQSPSVISFNVIVITFISGANFCFCSSTSFT